MARSLKDRPLTRIFPVLQSAGKQYPSSRGAKPQSRRPFFAAVGFGPMRCSGISTGDVAVTVPERKSPSGETVN
jgi:hypothetical protein